MDFHFTFHTRVGRNLLERALKNLLVASLGIGPRDSFAFIHDDKYSVLRDPICDFVAQTGAREISLEIAHDGIQPLAESVRSIILGSEFSVILFGLVHNIWHTPERKKAKYELNKRLASLVCAPEDFAGGASNVEGFRLVELAKSIRRIYETNAEFKVTTSKGTDFRAIIGTIFCEDGKYCLPGHGGDFPAGEVGFGPIEGSVHGRIVYDVKVQHIGILESPLVLEVRNDKVVEVSGENAADWERVCRQRGEILNFISEISVGLNPGGQVTAAPDFIPEEKNLGTLHCGHGGNASYGKRHGPHLDGVMNSPTIIVGGFELMQNGKLSPGLVPEGLLDWIDP